MIFVIKKKSMYFLLFILLIAILGVILKTPVQKLIYPIDH